MVVRVSGVLAGGRSGDTHAGRGRSYLVEPGEWRDLETPRRAGIERTQEDGSPRNSCILERRDSSEAPAPDGMPLGYDKLADLLPRTDETPVDWLAVLFDRLRSETRSELLDDWTAILLHVT